MKIGFYESDITPPLGCFMWGYGEERLAEDVNDKLFAKAAVIENDVYVQVISIGDFAIYIYPGEMFVEYSHRTKKNSPFTFNMVVENSNAEVGYVPTLEAFAENSDLYEASPTYSSSLIPEAGNILCDKAIEIAKRGYHGNEV